MHLSLAALGFGPGDEAIVPAFTWISTANVVEQLGGKVIFCDIDINTFNIDTNLIRSKLTPRTKAILPVHLFGMPADMEPITALAKEHNLHVIEDAAFGFHFVSAGIDVGVDLAYDMICYPCVFRLKGNVYMLYNGDKFEVDGFGLARLDSN